MSKGSVYLTYYSKADKLDNCYKIAISRWIPSFIKKCNKIYDTEEKGCYVHLPELSPSEDILVKYKLYKIQFEVLESNFKEYLELSMKPNSHVFNIIKNIRKLLDEGHDIAFVCYEKDTDKCHRKVFGDLFSDMGYNIIRF